MSAIINISPFIAKIIGDMLLEQGAVLDVDTVYEKLNAIHGEEIFQASRILAEIAIRQKIKSFLKNSYSVNGDGDDAQLKLLKDEAPATIAVKQPGGGYAYVPLNIARPEDFRAATDAKVKNIDNARAALDKWREFIDPIVKIMESDKVPFLEAQKIVHGRLTEEAK